MIFKHIGKTPEEWAASAALPPGKLIRALVSTVQSLARTSHQIPDVTKETPPDIDKLFKTTGIVRSGEWLSTPQSRDHLPLVIHWPSLLRATVRLLEDPRYLGISTFVLSFMPIFKARSYTMSELLQRKALSAFYLYSSAHPGNNEIPSKSYAHYLTSAESALLVALIDAAAKIPSFIDAFRETVTNTYVPAVAPKTTLDFVKEMAALMWTPDENIPKELNARGNRLYEFSMIYGKDVLQASRLVDILPRTTVYAKLDDAAVFSTKEVNTFIQELLYARDFWFPPGNPHHNTLYETSGVRRFVLPNSDDGTTDDFYVVDVRKFLPKRRELNPDPYLSLLYSDERGTRNPIRTDAFEDSLVSFILERYPSLGSLQYLVDKHRLISPSALQADVTAKYIELDRNYLLVFSRDWLKSILDIAVRVKSTKRTRLGVVHSLQSMTEAFTDSSGNVFHIEYARRRGQTITTYPYDVEIEEVDKYLRVPRRFRGIVPTPKLKPGVYNTKDGKWFYSYEFLVKCPSAHLSERPELKEVLFGLSTVSSRLFSSRLRRSRLTGHPGRFSWEEDQAILKYYRPGMSAESKELMDNICAGKNGHQISVRARLLRRNLIAEGVYDLDKLPHLNYNINIQNEITLAKLKKGQVHVEES